MEAEVLNNIVGIEKVDNNIVFKINNASFLSKYSSIDINILMYPLAKDFTLKDFKFLPYDEYIQDASEGKKTIYSKLTSNSDKVFGTLAGIVVLLLNFIVAPTDLLSIRSAITTVSAYALAKEIWEYVDTFLVNISERWVLSFKEAPYSFSLRKPTTLTRYSHLAKRIRYGDSSILPEKLDVIQQSNSKNIKLGFSRAQINKFSSTNQILIMDDKESLDLENILIALKVSLNKKIFFITSSEEYFQGFKGEEYGSLDEANHWTAATSFFRKSFVFSRLKLYLSSSILKSIKLLKL